MLSLQFSINTCSFLEIKSYFIYTESNYVFIYNKYGAIKFNINPEFLLENSLGFLEINKKFIFISNKQLQSITKLIWVLNECSTSLSIGYRVKYKVIGLGWKAFYFKNNLFFKLGYSHLVFLFIPFELKSFKKKKKKMYHTVVGMNKLILNLFFATLKNLRISDIYSMNGIFDRACYIEFKEGKRSFLL